MFAAANIGPSILLFAILLESRAFKFDERITSGMDVNNKSFAKFIVSLRNQESNWHYCGGSILNDRFILTAAHCLYKNSKLNDPSKYKIAAGTIYLKKKEDSLQERDVKKFIIYPYYNEKTHNGDIGLIIVEEGFEENSYVQRISLPLHPPKIGAEYMVIGWGRLYQDGPKPEVLQYAYLMTENCTKYTPLLDHVCAKQYKTGTCRGDSGGPLVPPDKNEVTAVVSFHKGTCGGVSALTNVYRYRFWIEININYFSNDHEGRSNFGQNSASTKLTFLPLILLAFIILQDWYPF